MTLFIVPFSVSYVLGCLLCFSIILLFVLCTRKTSPQVTLCAKSAHCETGWIGFGDQCYICSQARKTKCPCHPHYSDQKCPELARCCLPQMLQDLLHT
ncbi:protein ORF2 [Lizard adenovirus 2]|uniref:Protein ORF2 n=1 Tax=Lizard adenovirus 2 TaxID=874272 RepID=A0A076FTC5_9ADEN|nr:protein ORF2 [Lizard adenovirus 2]AII22588.1 protein ORF2 [Lizard adenovirus 2]